MFYNPNRQTREKAEARQNPMDGIGSECAKCGGRLVDNKWHSNYIPRIPVDQGGSTDVENCVVVCDVCFEILKDEFKNEIIPLDELPFYRVHQH